MDDKNTLDLKDTVFQPLNAFTYIFYFIHVGCHFYNFRHASLLLLSSKD